DDEPESRLLNSAQGPLAAAARSRSAYQRPKPSAASSANQSARREDSPCEAPPAARTAAAAKATPTTCNGCTDWRKSKAPTSSGTVTEPAPDTEATRPMAPAAMATYRAATPTAPLSPAATPIASEPASGRLGRTAATNTASSSIPTTCANAATARPLARRLGPPPAKSPTPKDIAAATPKRTPPGETLVMAAPLTGREL